MECPDCESLGKIAALYPFSGENVLSRSLAFLTTCDRCDGSGQIPVQMLEWMQMGNQCKMLRLMEDLSLREGAVAYGFDSVKLSRFERGIEDPSEHARNLGVI